jgi:hypothetical protein
MNEGEWKGAVRPEWLKAAGAPKAQAAHHS